MLQLTGIMPFLETGTMETAGTIGISRTYCPKWISPRPSTKLPMGNVTIHKPSIKFQVGHGICHSSYRPDFEIRSANCSVFCRHGHRPGFENDVSFPFVVEIALRLVKTSSLPCRRTAVVSTELFVQWGWKVNTWGEKVRKRKIRSKIRASMPSGKSARNLERNPQGNWQCSTGVPNLRLGNWQFSVGVLNLRLGNWPCSAGVPNLKLRMKRINWNKKSQNSQYNWTKTYRIWAQCMPCSSGSYVSLVICS